MFSVDLEIYRQRKKIQLEGPQPAAPFEGRWRKESHSQSHNLVGILTVACHILGFGWQPLVCIMDSHPFWKDMRQMPCGNEMSPGSLQILHSPYVLSWGEYIYIYI